MPTGASQLNWFSIYKPKCKTSAQNLVLLLLYYVILISFMMFYMKTYKIEGSLLECHLELYKSTGFQNINQNLRAVLNIFKYILNFNFNLNIFN